MKSKAFVINRYTKRGRGDFFDVQQRRIILSPRVYIFAGPLVPLPQRRVSQFPEQVLCNEVKSQVVPDAELLIIPLCQMCNNSTCRFFRIRSEPSFAGS